MLRNSKNSKGSRGHGNHRDIRSCSLADDSLDGRGSSRRSRERVDRLSLLGLDRPRLDDSILGRRRESSLNDLVVGMGDLNIGDRGHLPRNSLLGNGRRRGGDDDIGFQFRPVPFRPGVEVDRLLNLERMQRRRPPLAGLGGGHRRAGLMPLDGLETREGLRDGLRSGLRDRRDGLGPDPTGGVGRGPGGGLGGPGGGMGGMGGGLEGHPRGLGGMGGVGGIPRMGGVGGGGLGMGGIPGAGGSLGIPPNLIDFNPNPLARFQTPNLNLQSQPPNLNLNLNPTPFPQRPQLLLENHDPRALDREPFPYGPYPGWQPNYRHPYVEDYVSQLAPEEWEEYQMQEEMLQQAQAQAQGLGLQFGDLQQQQQQLSQMGYALGHGVNGLGELSNAALNGLGGQGLGGLNGMNGIGIGIDGGLNGLAAGLGNLGALDGQGGLGAPGQNHLGGLGGSRNGLGGRNL